MATKGETRGRPPKERPKALAADPSAELAHRREIGLRLAEMRTRLGWSPTDLAVRAGLTAETVRALEHGETTPRTWTIKLLANALSCSAGWLAFGG